MNNTGNLLSSDTSDSDEGSILVYLDTTIIVITFLVNVWQSYQLGHFKVACKSSSCCGNECCDEFVIDISESESSR